MTRAQCAKCPWKVSTDPHDIPNGYSPEKHRALACTIARPADPRDLTARELRMMACHETHDSPCVGWLAHQLGPGNNLALRLAVMAGRIGGDVRTVGPQHESLPDTFPEE